jgi:hypothetical protein
VKIDDVILHSRSLRIVSLVLVDESSYFVDTSFVGLLLPYFQHFVLEFEVAFLSEQVWR